MNKKQFGKHGCKTVERESIIRTGGIAVRDSIVDKGSEYIGRDIIKNCRTGMGDG